MTPEQQPLVALYRLLYQVPSTLDLGAVGHYLLTRYARDGRASFAGPGAMVATLDKRERDNFLRYLRYRQLGHNLVYDDGRKGDPCRVSSTIAGATGATPSSESSNGISELTRKRGIETEELTQNAIAVEPERS